MIEYICEIGDGILPIQELIRCKECVNHDERGRCLIWECFKTEDEYFCADGKRKEYETD